MALKTTEAFDGGYINNFQAADGSAVTPNDAADLTQNAIGLYVGGAGAVKVTTVGGTDLTFSGVAAGTVLPIIVKRVWATGTTATLMIALH